MRPARISPRLYIFNDINGLNRKTILDIKLRHPYGPRAFDGGASECAMSAPDPKDLRKLGDRLDAFERATAERHKGPPPSSMGIAFRFSAEMVAGLLVGGGVGYGIDWLAGTRPVFLIVFFVLGAAAGLLNVVRAARELNAEITAKRDGD